MLRDNDAGWSNPKVLTILAVVFACGLACGSALTNVFIHSRMANNSSYQSMERARKVGWEKLRDQLQLTPDQVRIVTKELDDYAKYYQNIEDQREDVAQLGTEHILAVLTPDQRERFYKILGIRPAASTNAVPASSVR
jgi:uncharacterized membrane protein YciS (DUF1049 family)